MDSSKKIEKKVKTEKKVATKKTVTEKVEKRQPIERKIKGVVYSTAMNKTVVARIERLKKHAVYKKYMKVTKKIKAHSEKEVKVGDKVVLKQVKPYSKDVKWEVVAIES